MTRRSKKSEMLEVRLSHEDKEALRAKAASEGQTVSAVVRRLIGAYIRPAETVDHTERWNPIMTLKTYPRRAAAAALACLATTFALSSTAQAEPVRLTLEIENTTPVADPEHGEGKRVQRASTELELADTSAVCMALERGGACDPTTLTAEGLAIVVVAKPLADQVRVELVLKSGETILSEPWITVPYGETASIEIAGEDGSQTTLQVTSLDE